MSSWILNVKNIYIISLRNKGSSCIKKKKEFCMTLKEFDKYYVKRYMLLEKEFQKTIDYVAVEESNFATYSQKYLNLILSIGSEVDLLKRLFASLILNKEIEKEDVVKVILDAEPEFRDLEVEYLKDENITFKPWRYNSFPEWWTIYNGLKHNKFGNVVKDDSTLTFYQNANLKNVLESFAGLHTLLFFCYLYLNEKTKEKDRPIPPIKCLFRITNSYWQNYHYGYGGYFTDNGSVMEIE